MAEVVILEFDELDESGYDAVNKALGLSGRTGEGDWPAGLLVHTAGSADSGKFMVTEIWESREAQAAFLDTRLGAALGASGVTAPPSVTWVSLIAYQVLT